MNVGFYIEEMNFRGVANSTYSYALNNTKILKNKSIIFFNKKNTQNKNEVIKKFKKKIMTIGVSNFKEIDLYKEKFKLDYLYIQKSGNKDNLISKNIKTLVHVVFPQGLSNIHGDKYVNISEWLSKRFSNYKLPFVPLIVQLHNSNDNLKKKLKIKKNQIVLGCHGGDSSFDLKFVQHALIEVVKKRKDLIFIFLNINKFCKHPRIIFLKGSSDDIYKKKFINTCDAMIYGRSLGESFGLACGEFLIQGKKIFSYKFNRHKSHIDSVRKDSINEYSSKKNLLRILNNISKKSLKRRKTYNKYSDCTPKKVMKIFDKVFFKDSSIIELSFFDHFINFLSFFKIFYQYLRHKIYINYYQFFESKIINYKD